MNEEAITDLYINPDIDEQTVEISFNAKPEYNRCGITVKQQDKTLYSQTHVLLPDTYNCLKVQLDNVKSWSPSAPTLYNLTLELSGDDSNLRYEENRNFGFCKLRSGEKWFYVNNEKFYPRAYVRGREAHEHPNLMGLPLDEFYRKNITAGKDYGFNMVRFHSRIPDDTFLNVADELGIFVHVELRKYFGKYQKESQEMSDEGELLDRNLWVDTIKKLRNHPCIFSYCMGNEIRNPGTNPFAKEIADVTRRLDPQKLFIDTCAHGEFDRNYTDFDVQHMSYYFPYGKDADMFENTYTWKVHGSCKGNTIEKEGRNYKITRALHVNRPVIAHEICHYTAMRDLDSLEKKFSEYCPEQTPWWLGELRKLIKHKRLEEDYPKLIEASRNFQFLCWKLAIEAARRSTLLAGYHFLQLADTERYENCNSPLDCFDDKKGLSEEKFRQFNGDTVLLADLPERTFFEGQEVTIPVYISHFGAARTNSAKLSFKLLDSHDNCIMSDIMDTLDITEKGLYELCRLNLRMPATEQPLSLQLHLSIEDENQSVTNNAWDVWVFPDRPQILEGMEVCSQLQKYRPTKRYIGLEEKSDAQLMLADRFDDNVFNHLSEGKDVLMLYRIDETRARIKSESTPERYYLPTSWDRFKGVIWDRGTNCGAFIRKNHGLDFFPHDEFVNLQFHRLIDDCDKICLDDFPVEVKPIIQAIDKAARDRFDVYTYSLSELQPEWTMRKFAYLFELKVGEGRLLISAFNFTGIEQDHPAVCSMFESLMRYAKSREFAPDSKIGVEELKSYLERKGKEPRIKERKMTQFWQMNNMPLETDEYWDNAEKWIEG